MSAKFTLVRIIFCLSALGNPARVAAHELFGLSDHSLTLNSEVNHSLLQDLARRTADPDARYVYSRLLLWAPGSKLIGCFFNGTFEERGYVARIAAELLDGQSVNISFDFGQGGNFRACQKDGPRADVRISFEDKCCSAYVGQTAHYPLAEVLRGASVKLQGVLQYTEKKARRIVMHELMHVLGFEHEHQSPDADCGLLEEKIKTDLKFTDKQIQDNVIRLQKNSRRYVWSSFDSNSIMRYYFEPQFFEKEESSPCFLPEVYEPSSRDYDGLRDAYPMQPVRRNDNARSISDIVSNDPNAPDAVKKLGGGIALAPH